MRDLYRWTFYRCHNNEKFDADETNVGLLDIIEDGELFGKYAGKIGQGKITSCPEHLYLPIDDNAMVERTDKDYNLVRYFYDLDDNALIMIEDAEDEYEICFAPIKKEHLNSLIIPLKEVKRFERENNIGQKSKKTFSAVIGAKEKKPNKNNKIPKLFSTTIYRQRLNKRPAPPKRLIDIKEVCKRTGFARPTIYKKVREGVFPPFEKRGINTRWRESVIDDYVEGHGIRLMMRLKAKKLTNN